MKKKNKLTKEKKEKNPFKIITFLLSAIVLILLILNHVQNHPTYNEPVNSLNNSICQKIKGTPAWADSNGNILKYGVILVNQSNPTEVNNFISSILNYNITFVYNHDCKYCKIQISFFGEENWNKIKEEGLALDCAAEE